MAAVSVRQEGQGATRSAEDSNRRLIRYWLYAVFVVLIAIVMVGGATRMTGSGLSITEWKPIHGVIPPLNHAEWLEEFDKYRQIPQYQQINKGMSLEAFQSIFWWEWAHRMLARFVGFLVAIPLAFFWLTGRLNTTLTYNTWPLMDGAIIPSDLFIQSPWWINLFENPKTVQFVHRMFAYTVVVLAILHLVQVWKHAAGTTHARRTIVLLGLILVQAAIGVVTLLMSVPLDLGLTHQFVALMVLAFAVAHWRATKGAYQE